MHLVVHAFIYLHSTDARTAIALRLLHASNDEDGAALKSCALLHVQYGKAMDLDKAVNIFSKLHPSRLACTGNVTI